MNEPTAVLPPAPQAPPTLPTPNAMVAAPSSAPTELPENWPTRGYSGPQPWEVSNPPALTHDRGLVCSGTAGDIVLELAMMLAHLGYQTSISRGENVHAIYGGAEREAVAAFHRDYGIQEDPAIIQASTPDVVGPWTWEALHRLVRASEED